MPRPNEGDTKQNKYDPEFFTDIDKVIRAHEVESREAARVARILTRTKRNAERIGIIQDIDIRQAYEANETLTEAERSAETLIIAFANEWFA